MKIYQIITKSLDKPLYPIVGIDNSVYLDMLISDNRNIKETYIESFFVERPSSLRILSYDEAIEKNVLPDMQPVGNYWLVSENGVDFLKTFSQGNFEFVKIGNFKEKTYFSLHFIRPSDVLDKGNSLLILREDFTIRDWGVFTFLLKERAIPSLFVLPYKVNDWFFCSDEFKYNLESSPLKFNGNFFLVWDSENPDYIDERFPPGRWELEKARFQKLKQEGKLG
jgi:hypothetical protein